VREEVKEGGGVSSHDRYDWKTRGKCTRKARKVDINLSGAGQAEHRTTFFRSFESSGLTKGELKNICKQIHIWGAQLKCFIRPETELFRRDDGHRTIISGTGLVSVKNNA
jgi:hypothetical protein